MKSQHCHHAILQIGFLIGLVGCTAYRAATLNHKLPDGELVPSAMPLTIQNVAALAVLNDPDLIAARARHGVAEADLLSAGLLPDPSITGGFAAFISGPGNVPSISGSLPQDVSALITYLTGIELNITALMGMTMIVGIATEMAIFYVSEYTLLLKTMPMRDALIGASANRLRPIAMTTLAAILTLLPLALDLGQGAGMQQPLAIAIISGLLVQFPLVLLALPVLLWLAQGTKNRNGLHDPNKRGRP
jgi:hypothetical protein